MFKKMMLVVLCVAMLVPVQAARADGPVVLGMGRLTSIAVSPDGTRLAVGTAIGVYFYDSLTFAPQGFWDTGYSVTFLRWSPRNDVLAVIHNYGQVDFRSLADSSVLWQTTLPRYGRAVEFSPDGTQAIVSTKSKYANVFDALSGAPQGKVVDDVISMPDWYTSISPNRQWQASTYYWNNCEIYLRAFGGAKSARYTLHDPNGDIDCKSHVFAWSPDSLTLYSAGSATVYAWDVMTGQPLRQLNGFSGSVSNVVWSADGRSIISYEGDNLVVSDIANRLPVRAIQPKQAAGDLLMTPWGDLMMENWAGDFIFYDATTLAEKRRYATGGDLSSYAFSPDGQYLATGGYNQIVNIRDAITGRALFDLRVSTTADRVSALVFGADSRTLFVLETDGILWQWDLTTRTSTSFQIPGAGVERWRYFVGATYPAANHVVAAQYRYIAINPQGTRLATIVGYPQAIKIWDLTSGTLTATYTGHTDWISDLAFNPAGDQLASGSADGTIRIWPVP